MQPPQQANDYQAADPKNCISIRKSYCAAPRIQKKTNAQCGKPLRRTERIAQLHKIAALAPRSIAGGKRPILGRPGPSFFTLFAPFHTLLLPCIITIPSPYLRPTGAASSSDFVTKSEDEAAQVGRRYGEDRAQVRLKQPPGWGMLSMIIAQHAEGCSEGFC